MFVCTKCLVDKDEQEFYFRNKESGVKERQCKKCRYESKKEFRRFSNPHWNFSDFAYSLIEEEKEHISLIAYNIWKNTGRTDTVANWLEAEKISEERRLKK